MSFRWDRFIKLVGGALWFYGSYLVAEAWVARNPGVELWLVWAPVMALTYLGAIAALLLFCWLTEPRNR